MKPNKEYLVIDIPVFDDIILYVVGDIGKCVKGFLKTEYPKNKEFFDGVDTTLNLAYSDELKQSKAFTARTIIDLPENRSASLVFIKANDDSARKTVIHESIHAAWLFLDKKGINVDIDNDEILCYLVEFITEAIWEYREKRKKYLKFLGERKKDKDE